jgi:hypothetical protein
MLFFDQHIRIINEKVAQQAWRRSWLLSLWSSWGPVLTSRSLTVLMRPRGSVRNAGRRQAPTPPVSQSRVVLVAQHMAW